MAGVTVDMFGADKRRLFMKKTVRHLWSLVVEVLWFCAVSLPLQKVAYSHLFTCEFYFILKTA